MNPAHKKRFLLIQEIGCVACWMRGIYGNPPDIHHLLFGGKRMGHRYTIGLCPWHHRGVSDLSDPDSILGPSLARGSKPFHAEFGSDEDLLRYQDRLIWKKDCVHGKDRIYQPKEG